MRCGQIKDEAKSATYPTKPPIPPRTDLRGHGPPAPALPSLAEAGWRRRAALRAGRAPHQGADLRLQDVRAVRAPQHRHDLPDDLPEEPAQRPLRRRSPERPLRG